MRFYGRIESDVRLRQVDVMGRRQTDHYTRKAKEQGFAARSVFKLDEINSKHRIFKSGQRVLDLGCAPGSWLKYMAQKVGQRGYAVGIDRTEVSPMAPNVSTLTGDIYETDADVFFDLAGGLFDVITSDMAPDTCGNRFVDHVRSVELCRRALDLTNTLLMQNGTFVCKVFEGEDLVSLVDDMRQVFSAVKRVKPKSTRSESVELFLIGLDKRNPPDHVRDDQTLQADS
jgi:23S rRNA (uridine2552-2'-O)-methyltransferase